MFSPNYGKENSRDYIWCQWLTSFTRCEILLLRCVGFDFQQAWSIRNAWFGSNPHPVTYCMCISMVCTKIFPQLIYVSISLIFLPLFELRKLIVSVFFHTYCRSACVNRISCVIPLSLKKSFLFVYFCMYIDLSTVQVHVWIDNDFRLVSICPRDNFWFETCTATVVSETKDLVCSRTKMFFRFAVFLIMLVENIVIDFHQLIPTYFTYNLFTIYRYVHK